LDRHFWECLSSLGNPYMEKIRISCEGRTFFAQLNAFQSSRKIWDALPIKSCVNTWGDEIYFEIPVSCGVENGYAKETVELGDVGYWPKGKCFCIFFGMTPMSKKGKIRPASTVNVLGKIDGGLKELKKVRDGSEISMERL